jgi:hypothetical protein
MVHKIMDHSNWHPYYGREEVSVDVEDAVCIHHAVLDKRFFKARVVDKGHDHVKIRENFADRWVGDQRALI